MIWRQLCLVSCVALALCLHLSEFGAAGAAELDPHPHRGAWLKDSVWYVPAGGLAAVAASPDRGRVITLFDQTVYVIEGYRDGYFWGVTRVQFWPPQQGPVPPVSPPTCMRLLGSVTPEGAITLSFTPVAYLILQPAVRAPRGLHDAIAGNAAGEPAWLAALDRHTAAAIGTHGLAVSIVLAAVFVAVAVGILFPATARPALVLAAVVSLAIWVAGENFGGIFTGQGTDPNSGPLLVLLAAAYWPLRASAGA